MTISILDNDFTAWPRFRTYHSVRKKGYFLHQYFYTNFFTLNFLLFYTKIFVYLHQFFCTKIFAFLHQNFCFITPIFFYTKIFAFFTPKCLCFLHQHFCFFYTNIFAFFTPTFFVFFTPTFFSFLDQNFCFFWNLGKYFLEKNWCKKGKIIGVKIIWCTKIAVKKVFPTENCFTTAFRFIFC